MKMIDIINMNKKMQAIEIHIFLGLDQNFLLLSGLMLSSRSEFLKGSSMKINLIKYIRPQMHMNILIIN